MQITRSIIWFLVVIAAAVLLAFRSRWLPAPVESEPPPALVSRGDVTQTILAPGQLVENLLDTTIKFNREGGSVAAVRAREAGQVRLIVRGSGIGIPPEEQALVVGCFQRGRNAFEYPGSGLGLAIVQAVVDRQGGEMEIESGGEGTEVRVIFGRPAKPGLFL